MNNKKGFAFVILLLFTIISFMLVFTVRADARAGGGHRFSGGSSHRSSFGSHSRSSRSSHHSRPLTEEEKKAFRDFFRNNWHFLFMLALLHTLSWLALYRRLGFNDDPDEKFKFWWILPLLMFITLAFSIITPLYLLLELKFIIDDKKRGKFKSITALGLEKYEKYEKELAEAKAAAEAEMIGILRENDQDFNLEAFKSRTEKAFLEIQESWCNRDLSKSERFLADGTYEQFQIQINQMLATHEKDVMEEIAVNHMNLEKVESKAGFDAIYISINASAINYQINDMTQELISGNRHSLDKFTEIWCFMRRKGAKSINGNGLIEGYCPNCGAPLEGSRISKCKHCSAILRSGQHDWVLTGITQLSEWRDTSYKSIPGMKSLLQKDSAFNAANIEDRLSVMFWRLNEALRTQSIDPVRKISTQSFMEKLDLSKPLDGFPATNNTAVGSIEIIGICKEKDCNVILGQITWSGYSRISCTQIYRKTVFKLIRDEKALTNEKTCFCNSHCPNCGAPETNTGNNVCEYCQTAVNSHKVEWILDDIMPADSSNARNYIFKAMNLEASLPVESEIQVSSAENQSDFEFDLNTLDYISGTDLLRLTIAMMLADKVIDQSEMNIINKICEVKQISPDKLKSYISELRNISDPVQYALDTTAIRLDENLLMLLILIATADGNIASEEAAMLQKLADKMGVPQPILNRTINTVLENQN